MVAHRSYTASMSTKRKPNNGAKKKVYNKKNYIPKEIRGYGRIENKFFDTTLSDIALNNTWTNLAPTTPAAVLCLSAPAQGTEEDEHIGRTFFINSIFVRGTAIMPERNSFPSLRNDIDWRVVLVWDTQTNGTAIVGSDVMDVSLTLADVLAYRNLDNSSRFIVLGDTGVRTFKTPSIPSGNVVFFTSPETRVQFSFSKVFKTPIKVRTDGVTAVVGSITDNSFALIGLVNVGTSVHVEFESRMRFSEKEIKITKH